eukprot:COSAG02_NODE_6358_length_3627_cov_4.287698_4_plen_399_part_01
MGIPISPPGTAAAAQDGSGGGNDAGGTGGAGGELAEAGSSPGPEGGASAPADDGGDGNALEAKGLLVPAGDLAPSEAVPPARNVVCVLGGPGSGKSSQCARLAGSLGYTHLSIGQALKAEANSGSEAAAEISACISSGALVPTAIVAAVLQKHMNASDGPVLLDGFPRTADQIDIVGTVGIVKGVLFLDAPEEVLLQRLSKEDCGDSVALLAQFTDHCLPVISMYDDAGLVHRIDASASMEDVHFEMLSVLRAVLPPPPNPWVPEYKATTIVPEHAVVGGADSTNSYTRISVPLITRTDIPMTRKTKIFCTLGPACWEEDQLASLLDAGCNVARFNFSHGDHAGHQKVLDRFRKVCAEKGSTAAVLLDTKGPEIRTAMLKDGKDIQLEAGQELTLFAAG